MKKEKNKKTKVKDIKTRNSIIFSILIVLGIILLVTTTIYFVFFHKRIIYSMNGELTIDTSYGHDYVDPGVDFKYGNKFSGYTSIPYETKSEINTNALGEYSIKYLLSYKRFNKELERIVNVIDDEGPVIEAPDKIEVKSCQKEIKLEYKATDNVDGDVKESIKREDFSDHIILTSTDSSNNVTTKEILIENVPEGKPKISLNGSNTLYLMSGRSYTENGAKAYDDCGNDISDRIKVSNPVDTNTPNNYTVTYTVTNDSGESSSVTRRVVVYRKVDSSNGGSGGYKVLYLTFDDGPGVYTERILNTLREYGVKATFFVTNQFPGYQYLIKKEYDEGHSIAAHTCSHNYSIYSSIDTYMNDLNCINGIINKQIGSYTKLIRFPGGSSNTVSRNYATGIMSALVSKVTEEGYIYFDWDISSGDASNYSSSQIYNTVVNSLGNGNKIILMHDIKYNTMIALPDILNYALANGYTFEGLTTSSRTVHFRVNN